ncbi:MAG: MerC domain-containing protein [Sphingobium sp.]
MNDRTPSQKTHDWLDRFAVTASMACLVHCLVLPILLAALPAIADRIDPGESFHALILSFAVPTSGWALAMGTKRTRLLWPLIAGCLGLVFMAIGILFSGNDIAETAITVCGSILLAIAHIGNWRARHRMTA